MFTEIEVADHAFGAAAAGGALVTALQALRVINYFSTLVTWDERDDARLSVSAQSTPLPRLRSTTPRYGLGKFTVTYAPTLTRQIRLLVAVWPGCLPRHNRPGCLTAGLHVGPFSGEALLFMSRLSINIHSWCLTGRIMSVLRVVCVP